MSWVQGHSLKHGVISTFRQFNMDSVLIADNFCRAYWGTFCGSAILSDSQDHTGHICIRHTQKDTGWSLGQRHSLSCWWLAAGGVTAVPPYQPHAPQCKVTGLLGPIGDVPITRDMAPYQ